MKPRSRRNRKRPRSQVHSNDDVKVQTSILSLPRRIDSASSEGVVPHGLAASNTGADADADADAVGSSGNRFLRLVKPYPYAFSSHAKARWIGRDILDVYTTEFGSYPASYYEAAIEQGRILVSDETVDVTYRIQGNDVLTHAVHRHEPAVAVSKPDPPHVNVVAETDGVVAIDKPGTMPVHPCGGYHENSLMRILERHAPDYGKLYTVHRLDRLTSGLVILARTSSVAQKWGRAIQERDACEKLYLARVRGRFPQCCPPGRIDELNEASEPPAYGEWEVNMRAEAEPSADRRRERNAHVYWVTDLSGRRCCDATSLRDLSLPGTSVEEWLASLDDGDDGGGEAATTSSKLRWLHVACPVRVEKPKIGVCAAGTFRDLDDPTYLKTVKPAETSFGVVTYDAGSDSTVVLCRPGTGRTHQIRLHLQHLGHPIANDPNYGGRLWYGDPEGERACREATKRLDAMDDRSDGEPKDSLPDNCNAGGRGKQLVIADVPATAGEIQRMAGIRRREEEPIDDFILRTCVWCSRSGGKEEDRHVLEFLVRSSGIWLHAIQYKVKVEGNDNSFRFRTEVPSWCLSRKDTPA